MEWKTIESAPKDGTEILLGVNLKWNKISLDKKEPRIGSGFFCAGAYWFDAKSNVWRNRIANFVTAPKAWMPIPAEPKELFK